jgi:16S rRNA (cytidine1402-2'-O)-methyltransferase
MLYIIATPIGNLGDITLRSIDILENIEVLLCEDTRKTGLLLQNLKIKNKPQLVQFYDEIEQQKIPQVISWLSDGKEVGLVTDAGTPLLSDPGWLLVKKCQKENLAYTAIPGPSAMTNALVLSGLAMGRFCYLGFLPKKSNDRKKILEQYKTIDGAKVIFESPFRLKELLQDIEQVYGGETEMVVCREMTKKFEEVIRAKVVDMANLLPKEIKGEIVVVVG